MEIVEQRRARAMALPGFDEEFSDIVEYILRITYRIWEGNCPDLVLRYYRDDCVIHTLAGPIVGARRVAENTRATLAAFPDRRLLGDDVVWSDEGPAGFYTSHRITSPMTHTGPGHWGPPTGRAARVRTIADCLVRENRIYEEWLMRDGLAMATQLGLDPDPLAREMAKKMRANTALQAWARAEIERVQNEPGRGPDSNPKADPAAIACAFLRALLGGDAPDLVRRQMRPNATLHGPSGRELTGPEATLADAGALRGGLDRPVFSIDHVAVNPPLSSGVVSVAVRWLLTGRYARPGIYGAPTGAQLMLLGATHLDIAAAEVTEAWTVFDELAVRAQVAGALAPAANAE